MARLNESAGGVISRRRRLTGGVMVGVSAITLAAGCSSEPLGSSSGSSTTLQPVIFKVSPINADAPVPKHAAVTQPPQVTHTLPTTHVVESRYFSAKGTRINPITFNTSYSFLEMVVGQDGDNNKGIVSFYDSTNGTSHLAKPSGFEAVSCDVPGTPASYIGYAIVSGSVPPIFPLPAPTPKPVQESNGDIVWGAKLFSGAGEAEKLCATHDAATSVLQGLVEELGETPLSN